MENLTPDTYYFMWWFNGRPDTPLKRDEHYPCFRAMIAEFGPKVDPWINYYKKDV